MEDAQLPPVSKGFECIECAVELVEFEGETCDDCAKALA